MSTLLATTSSPLLAQFNQAGVLGLADVHTARRLGQLCQEQDHHVWLAAALCVRALRAGSVCVDLRTLSADAFDVDEERIDVADLPWPEPDAWLAAVQASPMVTVGADARGVRPLRLVDGLLYLERYWGYQESVRRALASRRDAPVSTDLERLRASLDELFSTENLPPDEPDLQRRAVATAVCARISVIAGGPGTGKTCTVARLLTALWDQDPGLRIALCAPTGKAAVRMHESLLEQLPQLPERARGRLGEVASTTIHTLLGWVADNQTRYRHDATNPLPYDVVVVDEVSMVALLQMARLVEGLPASARLVLVGDPDQLASVEAGAVLADIVGANLEPLPELAAQLAAVDADGWQRRGAHDHADAFDATGVVRLRHVFRFDGAIKDLALAIQRGDADKTLEVLGDGRSVSLVDEPILADGPALEPLRRRITNAGAASVRAARAGDAERAVAALGEHRLLCGHRLGPFGVGHWSWRAERWVAEAVDGLAGEEFYIGRPLIVNKNLRHVELNNGDTGVIVKTPQGPRAAFGRAGSVVLFSPGALSDISTLWAMTVHKSQGSQFGHVSLVLPPEDSPVLTRELLYTAVTRARHGVTVYGSPEAVRAAVERPARRASGLRERLTER